MNVFYFQVPLAGKVVEVIRGARRKVLAIKIAADSTQELKDFGTKDAAKMSARRSENIICYFRLLAICKTASL